MNIEEMIWNGASEEEIEKALADIRAEKARHEEAVRAEVAAREAQAKAAEETKKNKEALKAEGRAYLINAIIAYSEAFDLLDEDESWDEESIAELEKTIMKTEQMIPLYMKMFDIQKKFDEMDFGGLGLGGFNM
jgi:hypothetical protein